MGSVVSGASSTIQVAVTVIAKKATITSTATVSTSADNPNLGQQHGLDHHNVK